MFRLHNGEEFVTTTQLLSELFDANKKKFIAQEFETSSTDHASTSAGEEDNEDDFKKILKSRDETKEPNALLPNTNLEKHQFITPDGSSNSSSDSSSAEESNDLSLQYAKKILYEQSNVKMTMEDLIQVGRLYNEGKILQPHIDSRKKELERHRWSMTSYFNAMVIQSLIIWAAMHEMTNRVYIFVFYSAAFLMLWATHHIHMWRKRYSNFCGQWIRYFLNRSILFLFTDPKIFFLQIGPLLSKRCLRKIRIPIGQALKQNKSF